ncbi:MAG: cytochrome P450 [Gammaproteobacteria bacterium]|nr:cytochrome P450 [Gammaproteobacteria bacterium]
MTTNQTPTVSRPTGPEMPYDLHTTTDAFEHLQRWIGQYEDIFPVTQVARTSSAFVVNEADALKHILINNHKNYLKGVVFERVKMLLGNGIIVSDGAFWRRQRRMIQPAFGKDVIARISERIKQCNLAVLADWKGLVGQSINITQLTNELALEIILRAVFGDDYETLVLQEGKNPFAILTESNIRDLQLAVKFRALGKTVQDVIDHRRSVASTSDDFLNSLMQAIDKETAQPMTDREMIDEVMTLIVAGSETSAATMNWVWFLLSQHRDIEAKVHAEIDSLQFDQAPSFEQLQAMEYVRQVIEEALRLYPPVWLYSRKAIDEDQVAGINIPAGSDIFISPYFLHRNSRYWSNPERVDPERFTKEAKKQRHKQAYIPFSAGPRRCIGDFFGIVEVQIHIAILAKNFRLDMPTLKRVELEPEVNLRSVNPFIMTLHQR